MGGNVSINGAGKTTFAREFLANYAHCPNFVNADIIADRLSLQAPESAAITAAREMEKSKRRPIHMRILTVAGRGHLNLIRDLKRRGNKVRFFYLWLPSVELATSRVRNAYCGADTIFHWSNTKEIRSFRDFWNYCRPAA